MVIQSVLHEKEKKYIKKWNAYEIKVENTKRVSFFVFFK